MKPAYWIGLLAIAGGIIGYGISRGTAWLDAGILIGALIFTRPKRTGSPPSA